ncbi:MAG: hypothetical protein QF767_17050, partial [Alphaproteobacteria bacterium]|nr:hypothetical protein [Alphaproteobacteria bacterium]
MSVLRTQRPERDESHLLGANVRVRPPEARDWQAWAELRTSSRDFLVPWEPAWASDAHSRAAYRRRLRRQVCLWFRRRDQGVVRMWLCCQRGMCLFFLRLYLFCR